MTIHHLETIKFFKPRDMKMFMKVINDIALSFVTKIKVCLSSKRLIFYQ